MNIETNIIDSSQPTCVLLHGMFGSIHDWSFIKLPFNTVKIDLPGHGLSPSPQSHHWDSYLEELHWEIQKLKINPWLVGYSMGGRVSMGLAHRFPHFYQGAILICSSMGIKDSNDRKKRLLADKKLLSSIKNIEDMKEFFQAWYSQELFGNILDSPHAEKKMASLLSFGMEGLYQWQNSMGLLSIGNQPYYGESNLSLQKGLHYFYGEQDKKYAGYKDHISFKAHYSLEGSHGLLIENPQKVEERIIQVIETMS